jgi:hypothetical protein
MSAINTNGINVNYPVPGVNNNSQGFRDNFASIKTNLNTASTEITDLQNKVVVKQALADSIVNNDMANTIISNAAVRGFRSTMYNLGGSLSGVVTVNASLGDVQFGTVSANTTLQFGNWPPSGTQGNIEIQLSVSNANAYITFPSELSFNNNSGASTIENSSNVGGNLVITAPSNVTQLNYVISTVDCGNTLYITPVNRPRESTQIQTVTISPTGFPGDLSGAVSIGPSYNQLPITATNGTSELITTTGNTTQLYTDMPIVFTGTSFEAAITSGTTYYVRNVYSSTQFTISSTLGGGNVNLTGGSGTLYANPISSVFFCTDNYDATTYSKTVSATNSSGNITLNNTTSLANNVPIIFAGNVVGGLTAGQVYYIKSIGAGGNITISQSRTNGVAGTAFTLTTATPSTALTATAYVGSDIWKKINLTSW